MDEEVGIAVNAAKGCQIKTESAHKCRGRYMGPHHGENGLNMDRTQVQLQLLRLGCLKALLSRSLSAKMYGRYFLSFGLNPVVLRVGVISLKLLK